MIYTVDDMIFQTYKEYKEYLAKSDKYFNAYEPWTDLLDKELRELSKEMSFDELAYHFRRTKGGVVSRLKLLITQEDLVLIKGDMRYSDEEIFSQESYRDVTKAA